MKKLNKYNDKLVAIYEELDNLIGELEEKRDAIEERAIEKDRDMTDAEQGRYDEIDEQIDAVRECMDNIESAWDAIGDYVE